MEEADHHAIGRAAGISVGGHSEVDGSGGGAGQCADAGARTGAPLAVISRVEGMDVTQVRRVMRLTLSATGVIGRLVGASDIVPEQVMCRPWPNGWSDQMRVLSPPA